MVTIGQFILGLVVLVVGADIMVRGAVRLAAAAGISALVIGLTVVAFGTSAPELAVTLHASLSGRGGDDLAVGNVVGSNIFNVLVILGISAAVAPLVISQQLVKVQVPLMVGVSLTMLVMALDGRIGRLDGVLLFVGVVVYTTVAVIQSRRESRAVRLEYEREYSGPSASPYPQDRQQRWRLPGSLALVVVGLALLVLGADWLVKSASTMARSLGVSDLIIGLTIVAAGTSLPEVATSVLASLKGERDIAAGNVVGSCIFNVLCVLGLTSLCTPGGIEVASSVLRFDLPVMLGTAIACLPLCYTGNRIARWEGFLLLGYYVIYTAYLVLAATQHEASGALGSAVLYFLLPLTAITLAITVTRQYQQHHRALRDAGDP